MAETICELSGVDEESHNAASSLTMLVSAPASRTAALELAFDLAALAAREWANHPHEFTPGAPLPRGPLDACTGLILAARIAHLATSAHSDVQAIEIEAAAAERG